MDSSPTGTLRRLGFRGFIQHPQMDDGSYVPKNIVNCARKSTLEGMFALYGLVKVEFLFNPLSGQQFHDRALLTFPDFDNAFAAMGAWNGIVCNSLVIGTARVEYAAKDNKIPKYRREFKWEDEEVTLKDTNPVEEVVEQDTIFETWWKSVDPENRAEHELRVREGKAALDVAVWQFHSGPDDMRTDGSTYTYETPPWGKHGVLGRRDTRKLERQKELREVVQLIDWAATRSNGGFVLTVPKGNTMFPKDGCTVVTEASEKDEEESDVSADFPCLYSSEEESNAHSSPRTTPPSSQTSPILEVAELTTLPDNKYAISPLRKPTADHLAGMHDLVSRLGISLPPPPPPQRLLAVNAQSVNPNISFEEFCAGQPQRGRLALPPPALELNMSHLHRLGALQGRGEYHRFGTFTTKPSHVPAPMAPWPAQSGTVESTQPPEPNQNLVGHDVPPTMKTTRHSARSAAAGVSFTSYSNGPYIDCDYSDAAYAIQSAICSPPSKFGTRDSIAQMPLDPWDSNLSTSYDRSAIASPSCSFDSASIDDTYAGAFAAWFQS
ncbi:hypothetical protein BDV95DRAFT_595746 [Massariosphaeria phaeospora]|uniref:RRM domain-containing protein n=1 Tax=Massariosphaeria phaeospora TaxID=100035 RepID=A0A7C8ID65_9PLEO|nr:hypothetical protein BDV95DRAFT_595746 [Massariosphaeria phaeospora]